MLVLATALAQPSPTYEALRDRFDAEFIVPGAGAGSSLPAHERVPDGTIRWADATIDLGFHLTVLATELQVAPRDNTASALHDALVAVERLDDHDVSAYPDCDGPVGVDGFFVRDDVPADFHMHWPDTTAVHSDWTADEPRQKDMSQDQVWHLVTGLTVVGRLGAGVVEQGTDLGAWADTLASRILTHVAGEGDWLIRNPVCASDPVLRGANAAFFAVPSARLLETHGVSIDVPDGSPEAWEVARDPEGPFQINPDTRHMAMTIAAASDGWGTETSEVLTTLSERDGWVFYPLLHTAIHPSPASCEALPDLNARAQALLDELGPEDEPRSPWPDMAHHGWTQSNRFTRSSDSHYVGNPDTGGWRYHGLDYMALHNVRLSAQIACTAPVEPVDEGCSGCESGSRSRPASAARFLLVVFVLWGVAVRRWTNPTHAS